MRTKLWSVIPLFAVLLTPGGVNGNLCEHLAHQTAGKQLNVILAISIIIWQDDK